MYELNTTYYFRPKVSNINLNLKKYWHLMSGLRLNLLNILL